MPLGMEVGFGPADLVLDGDTAPPEKKAQPTPNYFWPSLLQPNGYMDQDANWYGGRPRKGDPQKYGAQSAPNSLPMSIVAKRLDG